MNNEAFNNLNDKQLEAVNCTEGPLLILAGAGSGKTTVLINRIANILDRGLARPWQILAITFTNKAADEIKNRLAARLGDLALDIWACTFHSACVRMLRRNADLLGYDRYFNIYDTSDTVSLMKHIVKDLDLDEKYFAPKAVLGEISRAKDAKILPDEYKRMAEMSGDLHRIHVADLYREYQHRLKEADSMDFDDLILNTVLILEEYPEVRNYWRDTFRYILIDEYQDTNHLQYLLASLLCNRDRNICVVGDDDQSIYKFRGATIENILSFEDQFDNCTVIRLEQNYRSTSHILDAANSVIRNNFERKGKELWTDRGEGDKIELYLADNENDEAAFVASSIMSLYSQGMNFRDFAVLYRINAQSNNFEYAFKRNAIPYRIIGGTRFFDRAEVKDALSYLNVISSANDNLRLERIINNPPRGIGKTSVETLAEIANREGTSMFEICRKADRYPELARPAARLREFANLIDYLREFAANNTPDVLYDEMLAKTGYLRMYEEKDDPEATARAENVKEVKTSVINYMKESGDFSLEGYLANVALYSDLDNMDSEADCVTLMTMHASKGLEFPCVFIVGMEESLFPSVRCMGDESELEEERRLCYVALTRAMKNLFLVCARQRMLFGRTQVNRVSRFIDEIPPEHINHKNIPKEYSKPSAYSSQVSSYHAAPAAESRFTPDFSKKKEETLALSVGDNVKHKAFGEGVVLKMTPMGGDYLVEINFSGVGSKKLMLKAAGKFLEILS